jgi:flagellar biosynthesis protein FlhG
MHLSHAVNRFRVIVNMAPSEKKAKEVFAKLYAACDHFLSGISLDFVDFIPHDLTVRQAVMKQIPFCHMAPEAPASKKLADIARKITTWDVDAHLDGNIKFFWKKLLFQEQPVA